MAPFARQTPASSVWPSDSSLRPSQVGTSPPLDTPGRHRSQRHDLHCAMGHRERTATVFAWAAIGLLSAVAATAQVLSPPAPSGRQLQVGDGDIVIVDGDDRVSLVRRRQAHVRVVADESARTVLVIADWGTRESVAPDGRVNRTWRFAGIDGRWPLESRWEGVVVLMVPEMPPMSAGPSLTLETPAGAVAFVGGPPRSVAADASVVLRYESLSGGGREGSTFDEAEREAMSPNFMPSFSTMSFGSGGGGDVAGGCGDVRNFRDVGASPKGRFPGCARSHPAGDAAHHRARPAGVAAGGPRSRRARDGDSPGRRDHRRYRARRASRPRRAAAQRRGH